MPKLGRNEPCWCGSGKKFKRCHLDRERQTPPTKQEFLRAYLRTIRVETCLHPAAPGGCSGRIVRAHTIQRAGGLSRIAHDGHIYAFETDLMKRLNGEVHAPTLVGIRKASTFTGFCADHDSATFRPLETQPFSGTPEQIALLVYRAVCRELYAKQRALDLRRVFAELDRGRSQQQQRAMHARFKNYIAGVSLAIADLASIKATLETCLANQDFAELHSLVLDLLEVPDIMVSTMLNPEVDFDGNVLQTLAPDAPVEWVSFSLIGTDTGGAAVFAWLGNGNEVARCLIDSLERLPDDQLPDAIVRFAFEMAENTFAAPDWWDDIAPEVQRRLLTRMETGGVPVRRRDALKDDGLRTVRWNVADRTRR